MEQSEKIKISSNFFFTKILFVVVLFILLLLLTDYKRTETSILIEYSVIFIVLSLLLFYLYTRPAIYYDNKNLYIIKGTKLNIEIPLQKIQSINFSVIGFGQGGYSYRIKYFNVDNQIKSQRIFPSFFANPISKFISCTKKQNSKVIITNWSFGINEFFE